MCTWFDGNGKFPNHEIILYLHNLSHVFDRNISCAAMDCITVKCVCVSMYVCKCVQYVFIFFTVFICFTIMYYIVLKYNTFY